VLILVACWRRLSRLLRVLAAVMLCLLVLSMVPLGANALVGRIEARVPDVDACGPTTTIVVLSAGLARAPSADNDYAALAPDNFPRILAGIELWRATPEATLVFAGGGPFAISESAVLQKFAEHLGVPADAIRREGKSQTTWDNAQELRALQPPLPDRIRLVSSALHLPRALIAFRAAGFEPCPYASDRRYLPAEGVGYFVPQSSALLKTEAALHELVGEALYRWRARG
jgi:uncharacterized SAM-binding protein YcdF (DUF218 family)